MPQIAFAPAAEKPAATLPLARDAEALALRLERPPRQRAVRALLEIASLGVEARAIAAPLLLKARRRRDRADQIAIEALLATITDQLAEVDGAGLALGQAAILWGASAGEARP